ncbi:hypothetical protein F5884DRAFT_796105 [Xylogone sp. PMI_703]|nr:hypothetical protein F5884DRAFT_796105 [Xylogone sp. PMI_703]
MATSSELAESLNTCRKAFLTSATYVNSKWKLHQLYGLHQLLLDAYEYLISALIEGNSSLRDGYEREVAILLQDIANHYRNIISGTHHARKNPGVSNILQSSPAGVSLILSNTVNPFRYALAPFASSVAAGNAVVLATESTDSRFFAILKEEFAKYLDTQSICIMQGLDLRDPALRKFNQILIIDKDAVKFSPILSMQNTTFQTTMAEPNFAIVDNGSQIKRVQELTKDFYRYYSLPRYVAHEKLTAVFIRHSDLEAFSKSFSTIFGTFSQNLELVSTELRELGFVSFARHTYQTSLSDIIRKSAQGAASPLTQAVTVAEQANVLLVFTYTSLEQTIDAICTLDTPPLQLAFLEPACDANIKYLEKWTRSRIFSVGSFRSIIEPVTYPQFPEYLPTLFPPALFSLPRLKVYNKQRGVLSLGDVKDVTGRIVKLPLPNPNQTLEFFGIMTRALLATGVIVVGSGLWIGYNRMMST